MMESTAVVAIKPLWLSSIIFNKTDVMQMKIYMELTEENNLINKINKINKTNKVKNRIN